MTLGYVLTPAAERDLERLDRAIRQRIFQALDRYTQEGHGDVRKLQGYDDEWRLRVGDYRVRYFRDDVRQLLVVLRIQHRREAYRA